MCYSLYDNSNVCMYTFQQAKLISHHRTQHTGKPEPVDTIQKVLKRVYDEDNGTACEVYYIMIHFGLLNCVSVDFSSCSINLYQ